MNFWGRFKDGALGDSGGFKGLFEELGEIAEEKISKAREHQKKHENIFLAISPAYHVVNKLYDKQRGKSEKFDKEPAFGSLVYCQLGPAEHSGIYVGSREIVHLNGRGQIEKVGLNRFANHVTTVDKSIWFPCDEAYGYAIGDGGAGNIAFNMTSSTRKYHLLMDNCHQFCSGCINNEFENADNFLWMVKHAFERDLDNVVLWKKWKWQ